MNKSKYLLELSAEEAIMLYDIVRHDRLYQSSYEPLKELIKKIGIVAKDIKRWNVQSKLDVPRKDS